MTSVMLECSYKFGGEYGWRVSLSGAADFDSNAHTVRAELMTGDSH